MPFNKLPPCPHVQVPEGHGICGYCRGWSATGIPEDIAIQTSNTPQGPWKCWICDGLGHTEQEPPEPPTPPPSFYLEEDQVAWNLANIPDWGTVQARKDAEVLIAAMKKLRDEFDTYRSRNPEPEPGAPGPVGLVTLESQVRALEAEIRHVRDRQQAMLGTIRVTARTIRELVDLVPDGALRPRVTGTLRAMASSLESLLEGWSNVDP